MKVNLKKTVAWICMALVCVLAGTAIGSGLLNASAEEQTVVVTSPFTAAIQEVRGSVVGVNNYQIVDYSSYGFGNGYGYGYGYGYGFPFGGGSNPFGGSGYGSNGRGNRGGQSEEVKYASGSGVVVAEEYVLTNYHVVEGASSLKIAVPREDGGEAELYEATLVAFDSEKDIAVLYVPGLPLKPVKLGDSDALQVGDWAICIGNAVGFEGTVTAGIVSGLDRKISNGNKTTDKYGRKTSGVNEMIQTDAAINSGNSGGGMFNVAGELVGIPTLKYSGTQASYNSPGIESIGMCIPINEAKDLIREAQLADKTGGAPKDSATAQESAQESEEQARVAAQGGDLTGKPRMGVTVRTWPGASMSNGMWPNGVLVMSVDANGPAEQAGLKVGDILMEIDGTVLNGSEDMMNLLRGRSEGEEVTVKYFRPDEVGDIEQYQISLTGTDMEVTVALAMLDATAQ